jgi:hypothetical protein
MTSNQLNKEPKGIAALIQELFYTRKNVYIYPHVNDAFRLNNSLKSITLKKLKEYFYDRS